MKSPSVKVREIGDELVLLDLEGGEFYVCRGLGPRVWQLLTEGSSMEEVANALALRYGISQDRVAADVENFLATGLQKGLLVPRPS